jgi:hypothetical protein
METCQPKSTPMAPKVLLNHLPDESVLDEDAEARFGTAIGSLMYLMLEHVLISRLRLGH